jgi:hypothetical protein
MTAEAHLPPSSATREPALAAAYPRVFASNGASSAAGKAVTAAAARVNAICPGTAP